LNVSVRADTLDVQDIGGWLGSVWDSIGVGIIVMDRRSSNSLGVLPN